MTSPTNNTVAEEWYALRTFLLALIAFILFLGVVGVALQWQADLPNAQPVVQPPLPTLAPTPLPLVEPTLVLPTLMPTAIAAASPTLPPTHLVQSGETLSLIATRYGLPLDSLIAANHLDNPDVVWVGQALVIPQEGEEMIAAATPTPVLTFTLPVTPTTLNGIPFAEIVVISPETWATIRSIYERGRELGRDPRAFSKIGDSTIDAEHFLSRFATGPYNLGDYAFLQPTVDYFAPSFARQGMAVQIGLHSWNALDPLWADKTICEAAETVIACEFRLHNPSLVLIRLGANDVGVPDHFAQNMRDIVTYAIEQGVIPVLGTKADRAEGSDENNQIIRQIAEEYHLPLWDFDRVAATLPQRGLDEDGVHLLAYMAHDYTQPVAFERGHALHNLTALLVLDTIRQEMMNEEG